MTPLNLVGDIAFSPRSQGHWLDPAVRALLRDGLAIGNLECVLSDRAPTGSGLVVRGPTAAAGWLADAGFGAVTLANNHILDMGPDGLESTRAALDAAGVRHVGAGMDEAQALAPLVFEHDGRTLALAGRVEPRSFVDAEPCLARGARPGAAALDVDETVALGHRLRAEGADLTICLIHWGIQGIPLLPDWLREPMRRLLGAWDIVAGSHAHILQPVVRQGAAIGLAGQGNFHFAPLSVGGRTLYAGPGVDRVSAIFRVEGTSREALRLRVLPTVQALGTSRVRLLDGVPARVIAELLTRVPADPPLAFASAWRLKELTSLGRYAWRARAELGRRHLNRELPGKLLKALSRPRSR